MKKMHVVFAISAVALAFATVWMVVKDWSRPWRAYQKDANQWQTAMVRDAAAADTGAAYRQALGELKGQEDRLNAVLRPRLRELNGEMAGLEAQLDELKLPTAAAKSEISPTLQLIERAIIQHGPDSKQVNDLRRKLAETITLHDQLSSRVAAIERQMAAKRDEIAVVEAELMQVQRDIAALERTSQQYEDKLTELSPGGIRGVFEQVRNAPLLDWLNPSLNVRQDVVPDVLTDYNFVQTETIDRCRTCHVNIGDPAFEIHNLIAFVERRVAQYQGQDVVSLEHEPVVMLDFWEFALAQAALQDRRIVPDWRAARAAALERVNAVLKAQGRKELDSALPTVGQLQGAGDPLVRQLAVLTQPTSGDGEAYAAAAYYRDDQRRILKEHLKTDEWKKLLELYRRSLIAVFNEHRADPDKNPEGSLPPVSDSPLQLAHPKIDLYANVDSAHPMKTMGCTVCHEGSGQETQFEHAAHTPREAWVDAQTGTLVPDYLVAKSGSKVELEQWLRQREAAPNLVRGKGENGKAAAPADGGDTSASKTASATASDGSIPAPSHGPVSPADAVYSHFDVNVNSVGDPGAFGPGHGHDKAAYYRDPANPDLLRPAIRQVDLWKREFGWHKIKFMYWEKPMHRLDYTESACAKCHNEIYDLEEHTDLLFEGRRLFAQSGCINCHSVTDIQDDLDVRQVGPSLVHLGEKLSPQMIATWVWSPKAFRPTTRMPHFFMLENNSAPIDILRTRTEVTAMTYFLLHHWDEVLRDLQTQMTELKAELESLQAEAADPELSDVQLAVVNNRARRVEQRIAEIEAEIEATLAKLPRYEPQLPPVPHGVEDAQQRIEELNKQLAEAGDDEDKKKSLQGQIARQQKRVEDLGQFQPGDAARGREVFETVGCRACHVNLNEIGEPLITSDMVARLGVTEAEAQSRYASMSYNQRHWYVQEHLREQVNLAGPELSGVGSKLKAARSEKEATAWLYDWVRNPRHYHSYTIMPSFRLTEQEALDISAYLLAQERPGYVDSGSEATTSGEGAPSYQPASFGFTEDGGVELDDDSQRMLEELIVKLRAAQSTEALVRQEINGQLEGTKAWDSRKRLHFLGQKMISHYGCAACHKMNGFEEQVQPCTTLDEWGLKDPHKLDFGYYDHAMDDTRGDHYELWKVEHEGLMDEAPLVTHEDAGESIQKLKLKWEHIDGYRRPWAYHKLHNTRIYDRGKYPFSNGGEVPPKGEPLDVGKPYDKLKMPKFFLSDGQVQALVTYVTSIRKPLVRPNLQVTDDAVVRKARGRQVAALYNCTGCHKIEGNQPYVWNYLDVWGPGGPGTQIDFAKRTDLTVLAPPSLENQGARTQPDWLMHFLQDVSMIRPWLDIRMPSFFHDTEDFAVSQEHTQALADYFAGVSQTTSRQLRNKAEAVFSARDRHQERADQLGKQIVQKRTEVENLNARIAEAQKQVDEAEGAEARARAATDLAKAKDQLENATKALASAEASMEALQPWWTSRNANVLAAKDFMRQFAEERLLMPSEELTARHTASREQLAQNWQKLVYDVEFLAELNDVPYPHVPTPLPAVDEQRFVRGEKLFREMLQCTKCHALGEYDLLWKLWEQQAPAPAPQPDDGADPFADPAADPFADDPPAAADAGDAAQPAAPAADDPFADPSADPFADPSADPAAAPAGAAAAEAAPTGPPWLQAPNLGNAVYRLQPRWIDFIVREPATMIPGTKMVQWWTGDQSYFAGKFPPEMLGQFHSMYGYTGPYQRELIADFIYAAGRRNYTPGAEALTGIERPQVELSALEEPADLPQADASTLPGTAAADAADATPTAPVEVKLTSDIELHDAEAPFEGTRVVGVANWGPEQVPGRRPVRMAQDPYCAGQHVDKPALTDALVVNDDKSMQFVFVHVVAGLEGKQFDVPAQPAVLDQQGCVYIPHVSGVMAGQAIKILNSDATLHNVNMQSKSNGSLNKGMPVKGMVLDHKLSNPEMGVSFRCDVHPWMSGWVNVLPHPFFATSDVQGRFEIKGLPPGKYTLEAWHEDKRIPPVRFDVEVKANTSVRADVTMQPAQ